MATYHDGNRALQDRFDTRKLADRLDDVLVSETLDDGHAEMIRSADHFFLATVSPDGMPTVSYKGGAPGFVRVIDDHTLVFPNYNGNGMYVGMGNVVAGSGVGMLFVDWQKGRRLRAHGMASIDFDDPLTSSYPEAQFVVRVETTAVYWNCPRYVHRMVPAERSTFVPEEGRRTPVPQWKREDWAFDALPAADPARDPDAPVA